MRLFRHILVLLLSAMLLALPQEGYAQKKTPAKTTKTTTPAKKTTTPAKKTTTTKKSTTTTKKTTTAKKKPLSRAEYEKQQKDLQKRIKETEQMISDNNKSVRAQSHDIKLREQEIGHRQELLSTMSDEIDAIAYEEDSLQIVISDLQKSYEAKKQKYGLAMRHLYKSRSGYDELLFILSANSMFESVRRMRYLRQYSDWRKQEALEIEMQRQASETAKNELSKTREERQEVLANIELERQSLAKKQAQQEAALASLKKRNQELQAELAKDQKQQAEIERKIQQMIDEERRKAAEAERKKAEAEKKAAAKSSSKTSTSTKTNSSSSNTASSKTSSSTSSSSSSSSSSGNATKTSPAPVNNVALTGSFRQNKGKLQYPVDSSYAILRHYKEKNDGNVSITISSAKGANACAVFDGTVARVSRSSDDYTIIIKHGDYMSVYSNLSSVSVKEGQTVKTRQTIGKLKSDVDNRRGELMFWIYGKSDAENPQAWLKR